MTEQVLTSPGPARKHRGFPAKRGLRPSHGAGRRVPQAGGQARNIRTLRVCPIQGPQAGPELCPTPWESVLCWPHTGVPRVSGAGGLDLGRGSGGLPALGSRQGWPLFGHVSQWWGAWVAPHQQPGSPQPPGLHPRRPRPEAPGQPPWPRSRAGGMQGVPRSLSPSDLCRPLAQPATRQAQPGPTGLGPGVARATVLRQRLTRAGREGATQETGLLSPQELSEEVWEGALGRSWPPRSRARWGQRGKRTPHAAPDRPRQRVWHTRPDVQMGPCGLGRSRPGGISGVGAGGWAGTIRQNQAEPGGPGRTREDQELQGRLRRSLEPGPRPRRAVGRGQPGGVAPEAQL